MNVDDPKEVCQKGYCEEYRLVGMTCIDYSDGECC